MDEPKEKAGLRTAWGRVADVYGTLWARHLGHYTAAGLDALAPEEGWRGLDVACGSGESTALLGERVVPGPVLGVDFAPEMVATARERFGGEHLHFEVDDAEHLSQPDGEFDVVTSSFGLMYVYDARGALREMARVLRPGGRLMLVVWGRARDVWWSPVIEMVESRAGYYSGICPMIFFYGLPGVLARMMEEAGLTVLHEAVSDEPMRFPDLEQAIEAATVGGPLQGLFVNRLDDAAREAVREALGEHLAPLAAAGAEGGVELPAEVTIVVAERPA
jgi:ubiquinone/menaquinone biosynthesis C-methylase UbiE